jgi:DNA end-binding protein Ku
LAMARAVWTGSLSFGLVNIPVRLYPATEPKDIRFHLMDARGRRVRYRRFVQAEEPPEEEWAATETRASAAPEERPSERSNDGVARTPGAVPRDDEVAFEDLMRGYETDDGQIVLLSQDEVEAARPEPSRTIEIEDFVALSDIDPVYFDKSYHLAPRPGGEKPYTLLLRAMEHARRVGIGRFVLRTKPHLIAIRPADGVLGLETLFFADEVRDGRELVSRVDTAQVVDRELEMAEKLIETLKTEWNPAAYSDAYRAELLRRIGEKAPLEPVEQQPTTTSALGELMEALQASVQAAKKGSSKRRPA